MKKLTDEEIDSLFKEAAANYEPAYHPSEWEVMNKKLQGKSFRMPMWVIIAGIGSLVFLSGIGVGVWMNNQPTASTQLSNGESSSLIVQSDSISFQKKSTPIKSNSTVAIQPSNRVVVISSSNQPQQSKSKEAIQSSPTSVAQSLNHNVVETVSDNGKEEELKLVTLPSSQSQLNSNDQESASVIKPTTINSSASNEETKNQEEGQSPNEIINPLMNPDSTLGQPKKVSKADSSGVNDLKDESKKASVDGKWFVKVMASPDNSSINFSSTSFAGSNFTALIEYQLTNRWSLSTGVILSNKKYTTDAEIIYSGKKATGLDGSCRVVDIPITLYFRIPTHNRFSFYSGFGFSSYLMLSENYKYSVVYNSVSYPYDTKVEGKNNEWFKMINLSLGVNYQLTHRWSLLAEPFAKLPMAGVGEGKVMLSSTGLFLGIKYKIH